ncbi:MAG: hypothetical protein J6S85_20110 [Methanobrevibacter sp.]|nr:hypothetical protein [Methanobrevibacter sp.]
MTKEELKQEAEDFVMGIKAKEAIQKQIPYFDFAQKIYLAGAEPRENRIVELEKENKELKTVKIPQLERRIASIRGCHSVDAKKLNARIEQVERLKQENAALKEGLTEAKDLLKKWIDDRVYTVSEQKDLIADTEQFLEEE